MVVFIPSLLEPPPTPGVKPAQESFINWGHWAAEGLVFSIPFNAGYGTYLREYTQYGHWDYRFGPDTAFGTGATPPFWTELEGATGLRVFKSDGQTIKLARLDSTGQDKRSQPIATFQDGVTIEAWAKDLYPIAVDGVKQGLVQIGSFTTNIAQLLIGSGPIIDFRTLWFPAGTTCDTTSFGSHALMPNHMVATYNRGEAFIYGNGIQIAHKMTSYTPASPVEQLQFVNIAQDTNLQYAGFEGILYAVNIYNRALSPSEVFQKAINPLMMYVSDILPATFSEDPAPPDGGGGGSGGSGGGSIPTGCVDTI